VCDTVVISLYLNTVVGYLMLTLNNTELNWCTLCGVLLFSVLLFFVKKIN